MLNKQEINNTIAQLENGDTTFDNCIKLAALYTVRNYFISSESTQENNVTKELSDILPQYKIYCAVKRKYQMGESTDLRVIKAMDDLCVEITEFITTLYSSTDMPEERSKLKQCITALYNKV